MNMKKCLNNLKEKGLNEKEAKELCRIKLGFKPKNPEIVIKKNLIKYL